MMTTFVIAMLSLAWACVWAYWSALDRSIRRITAERDELNTRLNKASVRIIEMMKERDELLATINREAEAFKRQTDALAAKEQERSEAACSADGWHDKYKHEKNVAEHRLKLLVAAEARVAELEQAMYLDGVGT